MKKLILFMLATMLFMVLWQPAHLLAQPVLVNNSCATEVLVMTIVVEEDVDCQAISESRRENYTIVGHSFVMPAKEEKMSACWSHDALRTTGTGTVYETAISPVMLAAHEMNWVLEGMMAAREHRLRSLATINTTWTDADGFAGLLAALDCDIGSTNDLVVCNSLVLNGQSESSVGIMVRAAPINYIGMMSLIASDLV